MIRGDVEACRNTTDSMLATVQIVDTILQASLDGRRLEINKLILHPQEYAA